MPIEILMPALSPTMTEGNLAKWLKKEGDEVRSGDVLAEIETDKATMEVEAADDGRLGRILVPEGAQGIKVNQAIALLLEEGEDASSLPSAAAPAQRPAAIPAPPSAATAPAPTLQVPVSAPTPSAVAGRPKGARIFASPLARRMALQTGLDLAVIRGSGPQGRIIRADIDRTLAGGVSPSAAPAPSTSPPAARPAMPAPSPAQIEALAGGPPSTRKPHGAMRRVIARRLTEAKQNVPHFYMSVDCRIDEMLRGLNMLNARPEQYRISINDFVIRAAALALRQVPAANASWSEDAIILWERADIAMAVALDDGLITPIIKGAEHKGLAAIAAETKDLAARARAGKLKLEEFQGGTFSISNLGMYGIREFAAVINPPQGCILAIGVGEERPVVRDGQLAVATVMTCTLSCDHRAVDGAVGAQFLAAFRRLVEEPVTMLL